MIMCAQAGAVLYVLDVDAVSAFYGAVAGLGEHQVADDHKVLGADGFELVVLRVPSTISASIAVAAPPVRRQHTPVKLVLPVASIADARAAAEALGGVVDPPAREWRFGDAVVCDGHDPEGNVFQLRQPSPYGLA